MYSILGFGHQVELVNEAMGRVVRPVLGCDISTMNTPMLTMAEEKTTIHVEALKGLILLTRA